MMVTMVSGSVVVMVVSRAFGLVEMRPWRTGARATSGPRRCLRDCRDDFPLPWCPMAAASPKQGSTTAALSLGCIDGCAGLAVRNCW